MESQEDDWIPQLNMDFQTIYEVWLFWNKYAGKKGFSARKGYEHKSKKDGAVISKLFFCSNEGKRGKDKRDHLTKNRQAETRTDCQVRLQVKFNGVTQNFIFTDFVSEHNHPLQKAEACYLLRSQHEVLDVACYDIDLVDQLGIRLKEAHELLSRQVGGCRNLGYTSTCVNNYLRDKRKRAMKDGGVVAKDETIKDKEGRIVIEDTMLVVRNRNGDIVCELMTTCAMAAHDEDQTEFILNGLRSLCKQYEEKYESRLNMTNDSGEATPTPSLVNNLSESSLRLKKKEDGDNHSKANSQ